MNEMVEGGRGGENFTRISMIFLCCGFSREERYGGGYQRG